MSTRKSREMKGMAINHGAPVFTASNEAFQKLLQPLLEKGLIKEFEGKLVTLNAEDMSIKEKRLPNTGYVGSPDMSVVCEHLLDGIDAQYQIQVAEMNREGKEWVLLDKSQKELGRFDWLCVTSHTVGHSRWQQVFGFPPPLKTTSEKITSLDGVVTALEAVASQPVFVAMAAFKQASEPLLPFAILHVQNHPNVSRIVTQESGGFASVVVHSTHAFAAAHADVYGSKSAAAALAGGDKWRSDANKEKEAQLLATLYADAKTLLASLSATLPEEAFGPVLHRWGSAFCSSAPEGVEAMAVAGEEQLILCGDFTAPLCSEAPYTSVELAALSGLGAATRILAKL